jgi:hypothetical protein
LHDIEAYWEAAHNRASWPVDGTKSKLMLLADNTEFGLQRSSTLNSGHQFRLEAA